MKRRPQLSWLNPLLLINQCTKKGDPSSQGRKRSPLSYAYLYLPILTGATLSLGTVLLWHDLVAREYIQTQQLLAQATHAIEQEIASEIDNRIQPLERMANRWAVRGGTPQREWEADAQALLADYQGYQAVEWIDPSLYIRWVVPLTGNETTLNRNLNQEARRHNALETALTTRQISLSRTIDLIQGGKGILTYMPIFIPQAGDRFDGLIVGVFKVQSLLEAVVADEQLQGYEIVVFDGAEKIYGSESTHASLFAQPIQTNINSHGLNWRLQVRPSAQLSAKLRSPLPKVVLVTGLMGSWMLALTIYFYQITRNRSQTVQSINHQLNDEIAERRRAEAGLEESETFLRSLYQIVSARNQSFAQRMQSLLDLGCQFFDAEVGILARVEGDCYTVTVVRSPDQVLKAGDCFNVRETLCCEVLDTDEPLAIRHVYASQWREHPAHITFGMESFIGTRILVEGQLHSTFSFSSPSPRTQDFKPTHKDLLKLMAQWIGAEIERHQAETALQASEERWHLALRGSNDGVWDWQVKTNEVFFSARWKEMLGYEEHEIANHLDEWSKRVHPDDLGGVTQAIQDHFDRKTPFYITEHRVLCKDGSYKWILDRGQALWDESGAVIRMTGSHSDITQRKQLEQELQAREQLLNAFFKAASLAGVGLCIHDQQFRFLQLNEAIAQIHQRSVEEHLGKTTHEILGELAHPVNAVLQQVLTTGQASISQEISGTLPDQPDVTRHWLVSHFPICDEVGNCTAVGVILVEISDRKQIEAELIQKNFALEQAKQTAEAANRAKSDFLAMMSHEIRTPMNAVVGMTGLLLDTGLTHEQQDFVETIRTSSDALLTIINDILDFSKIESGKLDLEEHPFSLRTCIEESLELLSPQAVDKGLELSALVDPCTPNHLVGDVTRTRQILVNLLSNALKFTEIGEVIVEVKSRKISDDSAAASAKYEIQFAVKDTGIGIPRDRMDRLFKSFSQIDASTTRQYGGTGLGLVISKRLSEMMGGQMWVESHVGLGSTFYFTIVVSADTHSPQSEFYEVSSPLAGKRLLIVDDNLTNHQVLTLQTQVWGMQAISMQSGTEAIEYLSQNQSVDVAILDWRMPDLDGLKLAAKIRQLPNRQDLPLILLTAYSLSDLDSEVLNHFQACLRRPIKQAQLYKTLLQVFEEKYVHPQPTQLPSHYDQLAAQIPLAILLVEDNSVNQKVALLILKRLGYRADVAANGIEAIAALRQRRYDVVLMDMLMPEMDGLTATRQICQEWEASLRPHIIAMTANAMEGDRQICLDAGMDDYISKPVQVEELIRALSQCQSSQPAASTSTQPTNQPL